MIAIIDFDDSFTWNIASVLKQLELESQIINWREFHKLESIEDLRAVILGPGPSHPRAYSDCFTKISELLDHGVFILGICLGHQILCLIHDFQLTHCHRPIHGQAVEITLPCWTEFQNHINSIQLVQRYNSLGVLPDQNSLVTQFILEDEVLMAKGEGWISYQFHPESVGTSCPEIFFKVLKEIPI